MTVGVLYRGRFDLWRLVPLTSSFVASLDESVWVFDERSSERNRTVCVCFGDVIFLLDLPANSLYLLQMERRHMA